MAVAPRYCEEGSHGRCTPCEQLGWDYCPDRLPRTPAPTDETPLTAAAAQALVTALDRAVWQSPSFDFNGTALAITVADELVKLGFTVAELRS